MNGETARLRYAEAHKSIGELHRSYGEATPANMNYVYILSCNNGFYVGCTDDLKERIERHSKGQVPATKDRLPIKLISYFVFQNKYIAYNFEKYLKSGSGRAFIKRHLI